MKIVTEKDWHWTAIDVDSYDGSEDSGNRTHIGYGDTEQEAIADLIQIMEDSDGYYDADEITAACEIIAEEIRALKSKITTKEGK